MYDNEFAYCRPSIIADCPVGYLCDQSFVLGRSICCHDKRLKPQPNRPPVSSIRSPLTWNRITPTAPPKWNVRTTVKKAPWYIKNGSTWPSGGYSRVTPEVKVLTTEDSTVTTTAPSTTTTSEHNTSTLCPSSITLPINPRGQILTTTTESQRAVSISVLQTGSYRPLKDGQSEAVGAITLVNDNGFYVLVDTGASSDTEQLLHSLSKEGLTVDQINTVVITHGHPGHMGNMNFFGQKPIIFNSMEYIGRHITPTALTEDLSILVHDVPNYGTMAVVGDLIPSEALLSEKRDILDQENIWDSAIKRQNANLIICMADWIIPGHGQPFRVLPGYRSYDFKPF
uniref:Lactamase_B domain-containing protein n=1 Tax=Angiostrongylus cantonensis TaxID=6313 RepID=A0A0K0DDE4_ANGCA